MITSSVRILLSDGDNSIDSPVLNTEPSPNLISTPDIEMPFATSTTTFSETTESPIEILQTKININPKKY